jgi:hypothetical protein
MIVRNCTSLCGGTSQVYGLIYVDIADRVQSPIVFLNSKRDNVSSSILTVICIAIKLI